MQTISDYIPSVTDLFGLACTLFSLVTGFFLGRRWLRDVGGSDGSLPGEKDSASKHWRPE